MKITWRDLVGGATTLAGLGLSFAGLTREDETQMNWMAYPGLALTAAGIIGPFVYHVFFVKDLPQEQADFQSSLTEPLNNTQNNASQFAINEAVAIPIEAFDLGVNETKGVKNDGIKQATSTPKGGSPFKDYAYGAAKNEFFINDATKEAIPA